MLVTGQPGPVAAARDRLVKYLDGDDNGTVVLMEVDPEAIGTIIGKKGVNAKRLQSAHDVKIDTLTSRARIRIYGTDAAKVMVEK